MVPILDTSGFCSQSTKMITQVNILLVLAYLPAGLSILATAMYAYNLQQKATSSSSLMKFILIVGLLFSVISAGIILLIPAPSTITTLSIISFLLPALAMVVLTTLLVEGYSHTSPQSISARPFLYTALLLCSFTYGILGSFFITNKNLGATRFVSSHQSTELTISRTSSTEKTHIVEIKQMKFVPDKIQVTKGDKITFINRDVVDHDVTEKKQKKWASPTLKSGESWTMTVLRSEDYFCSLHVIMVGKILIGN